MTEKEAYGQAFENGRKLGYEEGKRDAVEVVTARWEPGADFNVGDVCSSCYFDSEKKGINWRYCPHCGARMYGDGNERKVD